MTDIAEKTPAGRENPSYLPDFCDGEVFLRLLLVVELIAIAFSLVSYGGGSLFVHLALISVAMLWVGLTTAAALCWLTRLGWLGDRLQTTLIVFAVAIVMTLLVSFLSLALGSTMRYGPTAQNVAFTLTRNLSIAIILVGMALRYFYLHYESDMRLKVQAQARLQALQARIRPHFLFNSMNTIASLTHDQPDLAEQAIENLSDLFRASLSAEASISLHQELELTRSYIDLEALRLGERLQVEWRLPDEEPVLSIPALTLQPLVENAIYHGIEPRAGGGAIEFEIEDQGGSIGIAISNPLVEDNSGNRRKGNQMALDNIRERLALAYGGAASMSVDESETRYTVRLTIPKAEAV